ncbi:hypothetical protein Tdes44962_MAKER05236 [Teratosphaeria destructans]|uniref:Uncharacterized protein n=1 Tax=Teratosphaeria destructans TaxID=418781 RepID=A0A9W7SKF1_9PEZI|nr:hypothetical protein Tdes44962_MAKER05236 [Teratosphaeria destructans]
MKPPGTRAVHAIAPPTSLSGRNLQEPIAAPADPDWLVDYAMSKSYGAFRAQRFHLSVLDRGLNIILYVIGIYRAAQPNGQC